MQQIPTPGSHLETVKMLAQASGKIVYIMRGVSGSGKSTWIANKIRELERLRLFVQPPVRTAVCSADDFFVHPSTGNYVYDPRKIGEAHMSCMCK
jgi:hypothetical protein